MTDRKNLNREDLEVEKEYKRIRERLQPIIKSNNPVVSIVKVENYLREDRLARLILIYVASYKKCFINEIIMSIRDRHSIKAPYMYFLHRLSRLAQFNIVKIHKLKYNGDKEMLKRYEYLKTKCPKSKINYFEFVVSQININHLKFCLNLEGINIS